MSELQTPTTPDTTPQGGSQPANAPATVAAASQNPASQAPASAATTPTQSTSASAAKAGEAVQAPTGAPEKYEFKAPAGVSLGGNVVAAYSEAAKALNLTQDAAQQVLDKVAPLIAQQQSETIKAVRDEWVSQSKADKEFGGDKLSENLATAKKGLAAYGSPALSQLLETSGLGDHPEVIRMFVKLGREVKEDSFVGGSAPPSEGKSIAERMFANSLKSNQEN